jgi:hypothetical protein
MSLNGCQNGVMRHPLLLTVPTHALSDRKGSGATNRPNSPRPDQGQKGHIGTTQCRDDTGPAVPAWKTPDAGVRVQGQSGVSGEHPGAEKGLAACWHWESPLARPAPLLGQPACTVGHAVAGVAGARRMEHLSDSLALRPSVGESSNRLRYAENLCRPRVAAHTLSGTADKDVSSDGS